MHQKSIGQLCLTCDLYANFLHVPFSDKLVPFCSPYTRWYTILERKQNQKNIPERLCLPGMMFFNLSQSSLRSLVAAARPSWAESHAALRSPS